MMDRMAELNIPKLQALSTADARALVEALAQSRSKDTKPPEMAEVETLSTGAGYGHVPVRIYRAMADRPAPVIMFYHGGGHVVGSLDSYDLTARHLARTAQCTLVSVDYRMAPEHPFPAAVEDSYDATRWVAEQADMLGVDPATLIVCGDSAGGNLAAVVAQMARDRGELAIAGQALIYPVTDYAGGTGSYDRYGEGYGVLETATVQWFRNRYVPSAADLADSRASPARAETLEDLPPALVLTAECDVLRDEGAAYARALSAAGVPTDYVEYRGMVHGFFGYLGMVDDAAAAHATVAEFARDIWQGGRRA